MTDMTIDAGEADTGLGIGRYVKSALSFFGLGKPETLYHGSGRELEGDALMPNVPGDIGDNPLNKERAVYASNTRRYAIVKAITSRKDVGTHSLKPDGGEPLESSMMAGRTRQQISTFIKFHQACLGEAAAASGHHLKRLYRSVLKR